MGNFNTPALLFGLILLVASIGLFLFGRFKPELQRDSDNVYAIIGIICALILFSSAFSLSLGMSFQQLLMIGCLISLMWENIKNRQPRDPMPRRGMFDDLGRRVGGDRGRRPPYGEDRRPSNVYRYEAELDNYDRYDDPRRLRGSEPRRGYGDDFRDDPRQPPRRRSLEDAETRRARDGRDSRDSYDGYDDRRPPRRDAPADNRDRGPRQANRQDDWVDPPARQPDPSPPREGRGEGRRGRRSGNDFDSRPPQEDAPPPRRRPRGGSMDGTPINLGERPPMDGNNEGPGQGGPNGPAPRGSNRPPMDRPPMDRPPMDRPPMGGPGMNAPSDRPPTDRPPIDRPPINRPSMDRPPADRPSMDRPPVGVPQRGPQRPASDLEDDYVDFKPLNPPPDDELDNSSNFDD